ncbi:MAG TPA: lytic transglycosylase domain-containing protein, partial [Deferrisomatales bacterium]|nr:lytic transglycosylase domain-containing protein [Deferrisomatales bacterium]
MTPADPTVDPEPAQVLAEPAGWAVPARPEIDAVLAEFTGSQRRAVARALERAAGYLPMIRRVLAAAELPPELAYLPMVESHYTADARSPAEAVGLWQFIDTTAQGAGLRVDWWVDERLDPELATRAAARHLQELHARFGDWELVLAAYNAGPGGVGRALERSGAEDFWALAEAGGLRAETRRYVPKFYAALRVAEDPARFGFEAAAGDAPLEYDTVTVAAPVDLFTVARTAGLSVGELQQLNPGLRRRCTPPGGDAYPLRVPPGQGAQVAAVLAGLGPEERTDFLRYRVGA